MLEVTYSCMAIAPAEFGTFCVNIFRRMRPTPFPRRPRVFYNSRGLTKTIDVFLVGFDKLRRQAESKMQMGGAFIEALASVLCIQNTPFSGSEKSPDAADPISQGLVRFLQFERSGQNGGYFLMGIRQTSTTSRI